MTLQGIKGEHYNIGRELGRGGEGQVFDVTNHTNLVFKKYNEPPGSSQLAKLQQMVAMITPAIEAYAAWPRDIVLNEQGKPCGFVMRKLTGFVPLHMIFSPMDRKKMFPDKGYNFLVHVARNLATAFHKLHEANLIVGDVNEGNILISATGLVSFIDCDSFQLKGPSGFFFCEVGVPRYTPPELLQLGSFESVVRTVNTDSFSMAVLLFQLLFLGRHPFAGRNNTKKDIDEETAIRGREFAYSLNNTKKKLTPPKDSFDIAGLSFDVVENFHQAFEGEIRPTPAEWVKALDAQLVDIVTCAASGLHSYPGKLQACPWCAFKRERGIMYFLDDSHLKSNSYTGDIGRFVNGFRVEQLQIKKWQAKPAPANLIPSPVPIEFRQHKRRLLGNYFTLAVILVMIGITVPATYTLGGSPFLFIGIIFYNYFSGRKGKFKVEAEIRASEIQRRIQAMSQLIAEHDNPPDLVRYAAATAQLQRMVDDFKGLPEKQKQLRESMEEQLYNQQLDYYLVRFRIADYEIQSIGAARKEALQNAGIRNAADINMLATVKVPGIGAKYQQVLYSWRRQMESGFTYIPETAKIDAGMLQVDDQMQRYKLQLETDIRREYQSLNYLKLNINNRGLALERQIDDLVAVINQDEVDLKVFKKFAWLW